MKEKERRIKEHRTIQANDKHYMGLPGKFGTIVKTLGQPIIREIEGLGGQDYVEIISSNPWPNNEDNEEEEMPTSFYKDVNEPESEEWSERRDYKLYQPSIVGWRFDGLSRGIHLEILYLIKGKKLTVTYKGYLVYEEKDGDLKTFAPFKEWEDLIDRIYPLAKKENIKAKKEIIQDEKEEDKKKQADWIMKMKERWGL